MASPLAPLLTRVQASDFELDAENAPEITSGFLSAIRRLPDPSQLPDADFEGVFELYTAAVAARRIAREVAEEFLAEYSMVSRCAKADFIARACGKYAKVVRLAEVRVGELKSQPPTAEGDARADQKLALAGAERDLLDVSSELASLKAKAALADADRTPFLLSLV